MCLVVYIASDQELPEIPWDASSPQFHVDVIDDREKAINRHLTLPHVAYAGSNQGCGCGFRKPVDMPEEFLEPDELEESQANYNALASYIANLQKYGASLEIYACWDGDQAHPSESESRVAAEELASRNFTLEEKTRYELA